MNDMEKIQAMLSERDVSVVYGPFHKRGFYHPGTNNIYLSTLINKTDLDFHEAFLHEVAHVAKHYNMLELYKASKVAHYKMEHEAEEFRINCLVKEYVAEYGTDHDINIYNFMDDNDISSWDEKDVRSAFNKEHRKLND